VLEAQEATNLKSQQWRQIMKACPYLASQALTLAAAFWTAAAKAARLRRSVSEARES
jgi:hypothetical protein